MIQILLFLLLIASLLFSIRCNSDIFSPAKLYHASLSVYFWGIFVSDHSGYVYAIYLLFIMVGILFSYLEMNAIPKHSLASMQQGPSRTVPPRFASILWSLTVIPVLAQGYLIYLTGGVEQLPETIHSRVAAWQGLGPLLFLIQMIKPLNLVYFAIGLSYEIKSKRVWWIFYLFHSILSITIALLSGSRGFLLSHFVFMMMVYHYLKNPIKLRYAFGAGLILLLIASFLGAFRNNLSKFEEVSNIYDMPGEKLNLRAFSYGTNPLDLIFTQEFTEYRYGETFLTPLTNFIPRKIWPNKYDSGGVILTKFEKGRDYTGTSNMNTGLITEGILNFGYPLGIIFGFTLLLLVMVLVLRFYGYFLSRRCIPNRLNFVYITTFYVYVAGLVGSSLICEFCNLYADILMKFILLSMVILSLKLRILCPKAFKVRCDSIDFQKPTAIS